MSTPLMRQYRKIKAQYPDAIVLFRMGDFYETFEEDAKITAKVLGIALTKRANGAAADVPLAGFPHHALDTYLPKLVKAGYKVAICEQLEDPKLAKGIVKRDVIEIVTPGVAVSDKLLDNRANNFVCALFFKGDKVGVAFADVSTGEFYTTEVKIDELSNLLDTITPSEILYSKSHKDIIEQVFGEIQVKPAFTKLEDWVFKYDYAFEILTGHFQTQSLKGFGIDDLEIGIISAGAVLHYLQDTQRTRLVHIKRISRFDVSDYMILDPATKRNLEIAVSYLGETTYGTLFSVIDRTQTPMGARLLKRWVLRPLKKLEPIQKRLEAVKELYENSKLRKELKEILAEIGDIERLISRIAIRAHLPGTTGRANPRDMISLKESLKKIPKIRSLLAEVKSETLQKIYKLLNPLENIIALIESAIVDDPPATVADGGVIRDGYNPELDELRYISRSSKEFIASLQQKERERTGIPSLKIDYNSVFGYYIEITKAHLDKVPPDYIRKQTLVNAERFITPELKEYEEKIFTAEEKMAALEAELFNQLREKISEYTESIQKNAQLIAMLDCFVSLSEVAVENNYTCPIVDDSDVIEIKEGRHPVVEKILPPGEKFVPNDVRLDNSENQILIITGPNMSGKSVFLRQVGLIVLLAQIGSFVPASYARIGIVDRIFTRVGASDNIAGGESTFLVEMHEMANILNNATPRSLILLDEVGRGTSTFDGISIAWAITEYLHENPRVRAKTIFATHYHELNELAELYPRIKNFKADVREVGDKVIFLHKIVPGYADHSYGIEVAKMAGLPKEVTDRAKEILANLEQKELTPQGKVKKKISKEALMQKFQISLFELNDDRLRQEILNLDIDNMTPLQALLKLQELRGKIRSGEL
ncbi:DNA mismatch repair protein MutS [Candidatus Kryptonium thompsonii]|jgi:DNA mismatch repair protein MutS|uniref:DNA mismatch repair protein MutS n=3 Tax=Candidatus Kryptonium thompsonii TaxID=1633631 RepID=A0A0P1MXX6_9BACT|nr:DNA mismatch repair protein MutS [Candidatus Kryptonium thompsoni]CUS81927.1 DNA mismatch repair protein MutS [Candidatus Kryptonium thompsoni]CUS85144.1 DNA mismatch repair protein MutS [Candidatus Kryptonium thompsoni]CUS85179.1 DNA mismatch repair protein MutS [Candidatus Kryptonium thompsoni]CUS99372.1 DNA mismatch repair protein MutS [Candidatus Kryptonium thompsoni]CUT00792.1 DNA mismatch repair protein MutS [Candidatus Kryptonium thompsoni]